MRNILILLTFATGITGCSFNMPGFLGSSSNDGTYEINGEEFLIAPVPISLRSTHVERTWNGIIVRAEGVAPAQGYYSAALRASSTPPDTERGIYYLDLVAIPPEAVLVIGPERTRELRAAIFLPDRYLKKVNTIHVSGQQRTDTVSVR